MAFKADTHISDLSLGDSNGLWWWEEEEFGLSLCVHVRVYVHLTATEPKDQGKNVDSCTPKSNLNNYPGV